MSGRMDDAPVDVTTAAIVDFLRAIGIDVQYAELGEACFLPGVEIRDGSLRVDRTRLRWPGDLLHEAGHLAVLPAELRALQSGDLHGNELVPHAGEAEAIAWAYAACQAMRLPIELLFHEGGYHGQGAALAMTFSLGVYPGLHGLMQTGMADGLAQARERGSEPFPQMKRWLRP